jgi:cyclic pyranopterin phosphate synthase
MSVLADRFGRRFTYLRLSVTEACNFRCSYCLPGGYRAAHGATIPLRVDEIARLLRAFAGAGVQKVRLTGGEPSLRKDLCAIVAAAAGTAGIRTVALTTNGCLLRKHRPAWRAAGLSALNVSVDALDPDRFTAITGNDRLHDILAGIDEALADGFPVVKLNAVLLRGLNDDQFPAFLDYLRHRPVSLRFIELMQTGANRAYFERRHYRADALEARLRAGGWQPVPRAVDAGPAREYVHHDYAGRVGIIAPYSPDFCVDCNRLRVTSQGDLRLCLFGDTRVPLRPLLQSDAQTDELRAIVFSRLGAKAPSHSLHHGEAGSTTSLASIGG